jgi:hypothetical protein
MWAMDENILKVILSPIFRDNMKWSRGGCLANQLSQFCLWLQILFRGEFRSGVLNCSWPVIVLSMM